MTALGIALIVAGLTLVCAGVIFRLFRRHEPASSQEESEEGLFRINDELARDRSATAEQGLDDRDRRGQ